MSLERSLLTATADRLRVAVCVITYRRPVGLERLLDALDELAIDPVTTVVRIVVVDNDAAESARAVCLRKRRAHPLEYAVEPRRGIPQARNAALVASSDWADCVAFIDDDEVPEPDWLSELILARARYAADVITGPSRPRFLAQPAAWIEHGGFFATADRQTGDRLDEAFTGNVLISKRVLDGIERHFDERMSLSGGSDVEFFRRVTTAGYSIVWSGEAIVHECVPGSRLTLRWLLQRDFRFGAVTARLERRGGLSAAAAIRMLLHGGWCLGKGLIGFPLAVVRGRAQAAWSLDLAAVGAGRLWGLFGLEYREYDQVHGA
jgi:glycosyltransferase involved in cell wall biosynthesis